MREASDQMVYCILAIGLYIYIQTAKYKTKLCTQTNKTYKQQNTQTNKTNINNNKKKRKKKSRQNSHTEIMRHYGGR